MSESAASSHEWDGYGCSCGSEYPSSACATGRRPRLLDLFCGAGGCSVGYERAGFDVTGIDIAAQPRYPFHFIEADAITYLEELLSVGSPSLQFDAIHASPPCQDYSLAMRHLSNPQPRLIDPVTELLERTGLPWVIENVVGAPLPKQATLDGRHGLVLCGTQFGLRISRHRIFESSLSLVPPHTSCRCRDVLVLNPHRAESRERIHAEFGRQDPEILWRDEMGVSWMGRYETREAIPPAYTEFIGAQLLAHLRQEVAA